MTKPKLYFGHPINTYYTKKESRLIEKIDKWFPAHEIVNPSAGIHQANYKLYKSAYNNGMLYYYTEVLPRCHAGIFLPFEDDKVGLGVWGEATFMKGMQAPTYEINYKTHKIKPFKFDTTRRLTLEETRKRVYDL